MVLDYVGEVLVALSSFTGRLESILELGGLHIVGAKNFGGKYFVSASHWPKEQEERTPT